MLSVINQKALTVPQVGVDVREIGNVASTQIITQVRRFVYRLA